MPSYQWTAEGYTPVGMACDLVITTAAFVTLRLLRLAVFNIQEPSSLWALRLRVEDDILLRVCLFKDS